MTIKQWFESSKDYAIGLLLYGEHCPNGKYSFILSLGENGYNRKVLEQELEKLLPKVYAEPKPQKREIPNSLAWRKEEIKQLYASSKHLFSRLDLLNEKSRSKICGQIVANGKAIGEHYRVLDHFIATGVNLDEQKPKTNDDLYIEMMKDMKRLPQFISRNKSNTAMLRDVEKAQERLKYINKVIEHGRII